MEQDENDYAVPDGPKMGAIAGYRRMTPQELRHFSQVKEAEERALRFIDTLANTETYDGRWISIGRTQIQLGIMAILRGIARPERVNLPEDDVG